MHTRSSLLLMLLGLTALLIAPAAAQDNPPLITDVTYTILPWDFGYAVEQEFDPAVDVAEESDIIRLVVQVLVDADEEEDVELFYAKLSFWNQYSVYPSPEPPPVNGDTYQGQLRGEDIGAWRDAELQFVPPRRIESLGGGLYQITIEFLIPEMNGANQARLRGLIDYDAAWLVWFLVSDQESVNLGEEFADSITFPLFAVENPALAPPNPPPFADAGPNSTVVAGEFAELDGSRTFDGFNVGFSPLNPNVFAKDNLEYAWEQLEGPVNVEPFYPDPIDRPWLARVQLNVIGRYVYRLLADDQRGNTPSLDSVIIDVVSELPPNRPPVARISAPTAPVSLGAPIQLDARGSTDPDGDTLTYRWRQTDEVGGELPALQFPELFQPISGRESAVAQWQAIQPGTYYFELLVNDGEFTDTARTSIQVIVPQVARAVIAAEMQAKANESLGSRATELENNSPAPAGCGAGLLSVGLLPLAFWFMRGRFR